MVTEWHYIKDINSTGTINHKHGNTDHIYVSYHTTAKYTIKIAKFKNINNIYKH